MKLLIRISYNGKNYCGWQYQPDRDTVQNNICFAAEKLFGFPCDVTGCSRTDSGVHALEFCATVTEHGKDSIETGIALSALPRAFCAHLPDDIAVYDAEWVDSEFHARYSVRYKEYIYRIYTRQVRSPFENGRAYHCVVNTDEETIEKMNRAAAAFLGKHDFSSFMAKGSKITEPSRTVYISEVGIDPADKNVIVFRVGADGFLYNMVRIMAGTLISVAKGKTDPEDIGKIIEARDRSLAGETAPAEGLYLARVVYPTDPFEKQ